MFRFFGAFGDTLTRWGRALMPNNLREGTILSRMRGGIDQSVDAAMEPRPITRWLWRLLHIVLVVGALVGLYFLNHYLELWRVLRAPNPLLARIWLPLLFVLVYVLGWFGYALWSLLGPEGERVTYPDIDAAWTDALNALLRERIDAASLPCFLVLGRPTGSLEELFGAAALPLVVNNVPRRADAPVHFYASKEAIYITCEGASLLGRQGAILASEGSAEFAPVSDEEPTDEDPSLMGTGAFSPILTSTPVEMPTGAGLHPTAATNVAMIEAPALPGDDILATSEVERARRARPRRPSLLKDKPLSELFGSRLRYLCRKIDRLRRPYTPINGILAVVPLEATATTTDSSHTAAILAHDIAAARETLKVNCPVVVCVSDMERAPGFRELVQHSVANRQRHRLVGLPLPLMPDLDTAQLPDVATSAAQWIGLTLFPTLVYRMLSVEATEEERPTATRGNARLYQLLALLRDRHERIGRIAGRGVATDASGPPLLGGIYLAANGYSRDTEHAFVAGVVRQLIDDQNSVKWTRAALEEDAEYHRMANVGYAVTGVLIAAVVVVGYVYWPIK